MNITIIPIGDEILLGRVTDTNSGMIARTVARAGWAVREVHAVADDLDAIAGAVERALAHSDVVVTTGGIGPTRDDMTRRALMRVFGGELRQDPETLENVKRVVARRGFKLNELTAAQAMVPTSCRVIQNRVGTAPVMWFERGRKVLVTLPGVPFETEEIFPNDVFPALRRHFGDDAPMLHRTLLVTGLRESELAERLAPVEDHGAHLAYLPEPGLVRLRIDTRSPEALEAVEADIRRLAPGCVLADQDVPLAAVVLENARRAHRRLATAESCTGGNIARLLTSVPGSSDVYAGGVVAYSNDVKANVLGVPRQLIDAHGAVSEPVAREMARGAQRVLGADAAIATSGIAGPGGGTPDKPVGTVCVAVAVDQLMWSTTLHLPGSRTRVIDHASALALVQAATMTGKIEN